MSRKSTQRPTRFRSVLSTALIVGATACVVGAEQIALKKPIAVLDDKSGTADTVETVNPSGKLEVLDRDGKWAHVRTQSGKEGYVSQAALADSAGGGLDLSGLFGGSGASNMSSAAAGKGFEEADNYARNHGLSKDGLTRMKAIRASIRSADVKKFQSDGNVGAGHAR